MQVAQLSFRVDTTGLERGAAALEELGRHGETVERSGGLIDRSMRNASGGIDVASDAIGGLATKVAGIVGVFGAGLGFNEMISTARNFQESMNDVQEKLNLTGTSMQEVRDYALEMGAKTAFSASQVGGALSALAALGLDASDSMSTLPDVLNLASGASLELEHAADITAKTLNQFGLDIEESTRVVDLLAGTADSSAANVDYLAEVFSKVGPTAKDLGVSLEDVASAAAIMADNGVRAETTGTALRNMFDQLLNPSKATSDALKQVGLAAEDFVKYGDDGKRSFVGLGEAFDLLKNSGADVPALMNILGREIATLIPAVQGGSAGMDAMAIKIGQAASAAEQALTKTQGLPGAFKAVGSAFEGFQLALLGSTGSNAAEAAIRKLAETMLKAIPVLNDTHESFGLFLDRLNGVGSLANATAGPALHGIYGVINNIRDAIQPLLPYITQFGIALVAVGATAGVLALVGSSLAAIAAITFTPVTLAIAAIAGGAVVLYNNWSSISAWWASLWEGLDGDVSQFGVRLRASIGAMATSFTTEAIKLANGFADSLSDGIGKALDFIEWPTAADLGRSAAELIVSFANIAVSMTNALALGISSKTKTLGSDIDWPTSQEIVSGAKTLITAFSETASEMANAFAMRLSGGLQMANLNLNWPAIGDVMSSAGDMLRAFIETAGSIANAFGAMLFSGINNSIKNIDWPATAAVMNSAAETIRAFTATAGAAVGAFGAMLLSGIGNAISGISWPGTQEVASNGASLIIGFANLALAATGALTNGIINAVKTLVTDIKWPSISEIGNAATNFTTNFGALAGNLIGELVNGLNKESRKFISNVEWPTIAEIAAGAAKAIVGFADLGARLVLAIVLGVNSAVDSFMSKVQWPTLGQIVSGAATFINNLAKGAQAFGRSFLFELGKAIAVGIKDVFVSVFDFLPFVGKEGAKLGRETGEAISAATASGITAEAPQVEQAARDMYGSFKDGAGKAVPDAIEAGGYLGEGLINGIFSWFSPAFGSGRELAGNVIDGVDTEGQMKSPSAAMMQRGYWMGEGFAIGINQSFGIVLDAATGLTQYVTRPAEDIPIMMQQIGGAAGDNLAKGLEDNTQTVRIAADTMGTQISNGISNALQDSSNIKEAVNNVGDFLSNWAQEQVAMFAANQITAFFKLDGGDEAAKQMTAVQGKLEEFKKVATDAGGGLKGLGEAMKTAFGDADVIGGVTAAIAVLAVTIDDTMSKTEIGLRAIGAVVGGIVGSMFGATGAGAAIGNELGGWVNKGLGTDWEVSSAGSQAGYSGGEIYGRDFSRESRERSWWRGTERKDFEFTDLNARIDQNLQIFFDDLVGIVSLQFGALGVAAADSIFESFEVAAGTFSGEDAAEELAAFLEESTRQAYMHGFASLGPGMQEAISEQVNVMHGPLDDLGVAFQDFTQIVGGLMPQMRLLGFQLGDSFDEQGASAIRLVDAMGGLQPAMQAFDYLLNNVVSSADLATMQLKQSNISLDAWGKSLQQRDYETRHTSETLDKVGNAFRFTQLRAEGALGLIDKYTESVNESTGAIVVNTQGIRDQAASLQGTSEYIVNTTSAMNRLADLIDKYGQKVDITRVGLELYASQLDTSTQAGKLATDQISAFVSEVDSTTGAVTLNRSALQVYRENLDMTTAAGIDANRGLNLLEQAVGATGVAGITTRAALLEYINAQDMTTEAGRKAAVGAFAQMEAIVAVEDETNRLREVYLTVGTAVRDLNLTMDMTQPSAVNAADALVQLMGGIEGFTAATSAYYQAFFSEKERESLTMAQSAADVESFNRRLGLTGQAAIDTGAEFRTYVEGLDLQTEAGRAAYREAMLLTEAMKLVSDTTADAENGMGSLDAIIAQLPEGLRQKFEEMVADSQRAAELIDKSSADIELSLFGAGENMRTLGLEALASGTDLERATALNTESATRSAKSNEESAASLNLVATVLVKAFGDMDDQLELTRQNADNAALATGGVSQALTDASSLLGDYAASIDATTESGAAAAEIIGQTSVALDQLRESNATLRDSAVSAQDAALEYAGSLDTTTTAGTAAHAAALEFADAVTAAGASGVISQEQLDAYTGSLDLSTQAGRDAYTAAVDYAASLSQAVTAQDVLTDLISQLPAELQVPFIQILQDAGIFGEDLPPLLAAAYTQMEQDAINGGEATRAGLIERLEVMAEEAFSAGDAATTALGDELLRMVNVAQSTGFGSTEALNTELLRMADIARATGTAAGEALAEQLVGLAVTTNQTGADAVQALATELDNMAANSRAAGGGAVSAFDQEIMQLAGIARAGGAGASTELAVGLERLAGIARSTGTAAGEALSDRLSNMAGIARSAGQGATDALAGGLSGLASAAGSVAGIVQQANQTLRTAGISIQQRSDAMDVLRDQGREGAGYSAGLDRVTVPELPTTIHMDEAVLRADVANAYRAMGGTATRLPDFSSNASSFTISPARDNTSRALVDEVSALRREQSEWRREQANQAKRSDNIAGAIAGGTERQTTELERLRADNKRLSRQLAKTNNVA